MTMFNAVPVSQVSTNSAFEGFLSVLIRCYSYVGKRQPGQVISLGTGCETVGIALHEMVRALGFFHTSSRTDRDSYVIVYDRNIESGS